MKKSCSYCGRIHPKGFECPMKKSRKASRKETENDTFRSSAPWKKKRAVIRERDLQLCRICLENGTYNSTDIQVHHITPLSADYSRRLDEDNLISLCPYHHEQAENGRISAEHLRELTTIDLWETSQA